MNRSFSLLKYVLGKVFNFFAISYSVSDVIKYLRYKGENSCIYLTEKTSNAAFSTIVISLKFRKDRRKFISQSFQSKKLEFKFSNAVHGSSSYDEIMRNQKFSLRSSKYLSVGSIGCIMSHYKVWQSLVNRDIDGCFIFEDDVILKADRETLEKLANGLPLGCDLVYLGSGTYSCLRVDSDDHVSLFQPFAVRRGAYAYYITQSGAKKLVSSIFPIYITSGGIDTILGVLTMKGVINVYHTSKTLCSVDTFTPSNIYNRSTPSKKLHEREFAQ